MEKLIFRMQVVLDRMKKIFAFLYKALFVVILAVLALGFFALPFYFSGDIGSFEIRVYICVLMVYSAIGIFGLLRLYNVYMNNSKFIIALGRKLDRFVGELNRIVNDMRGLSREQREVARVTESLTKKVEEFKKVLEETNKQLRK